MQSSPRVGLESLAFATTQHYLPMELLAQARGVEPAKYIGGLGQREMAVPTPCEDTVTLGAGAALRALQQAQIDPASIDTLIVGTETGIDHSKPVSSYIHELLGLAPHCRVFETKHACYGATSGLQSAIDRILSGRARGHKAMIIASDVARYGIGSAGEPTQGAGAVAMVVSDQPRLVEFDTRSEGFYAQQVMDFWRPLYRKEALADGHYSIQCYLDALSGAHAAWLAHGGSSTPAAACLYHVPFGKMAKKAHERMLNDQGMHDKAAIETDYQTRVAPYLELCARIGNVYTGSLYMALYNLLVDASAQLAGRDISLFSYGSGCMAEYFRASVLPGVALPDYRPILAARRPIDVARYETMLQASMAADADGSTFDPHAWSVDHLPFVLTGVQDHKRHYVAQSTATEKLAA